MGFKPGGPTRMAEDAERSLVGGLLDESGTRPRPPGLRGEPLAQPLRVGRDPQRVRGHPPR